MKLFAAFCGLCLALVVPGNACAQVITNQPQSLTINNASTALFTVGVTNTTAHPLTYQWYFGANKLSDTGTNYSIPGSISGSTTSALTLDNVTSNQAGTYTVVVNTNVVTSSNAVLTVIPGTIVTFSLSGLLTNAPANSLTVQLFDHDKPVTVANFLHYIRAGGYTNMFFDRCIPNFVLQGGDYGATDQTNTNTPFSGWQISSEFVTDSNIYPPQVESEFGVGPLIHNRFGTLAMALGSDPETGLTLTNSATSAFFINLADNAGSPNNLDTTNNGPFTVFGRVIQGTNLLQYFNTLTNGVDIITNEVFSDNGVLLTNSITTLPVDYNGTNEPANANLVFCAFPDVLPSGPVDATPPSASITSPMEPTPITNLQGTASDDVGVAVVICVLTPQPAIDGTYPYPYVSGAPVTNYAVGTTHWSLSLSPGSYGVSVQAQDGAGNLSAAATNTILVTAILTNGDGMVTFDENGTNIDAVGYPFQNGADYDLVATAATNQVFLDWSVGSPVYVDQELDVTMGGFVLSATFISNGIPNSLAVSYPQPGSTIGTNSFNITGTVSNITNLPVTVTCQLYSQTTFTLVGPPLTESNVTSSWSISVNTNLPPDTYDMEVIATDAASNTTVVTEDFTIEPALNLTVIGPGTVLGLTNGELIANNSTFQATATPNSGALFSLWSNGTEVFTNPVESFTMPVNGLTLTAVFVSNTLPNGIAITYPPANALIATNAFDITGTISNALLNPFIVTCQIYSGTTSVAVGPLLTNSGPALTNWSITVSSNLPVGSYFMEVTAVDSAGNSTATNENFTVAANATLHLNIVGPGTVSPVTNGQTILVGTIFQVTATPDAGQFFYSWNSSRGGSFNPVQTFTMSPNLTLTATFISNSIPNTLAITYPPTNGIIGTNLFNITGTISNDPSPPVLITCQIYSSNNFTPYGPAFTNSSVTNTWSVPVMTNLAVGSYVIIAEALDSSNNTTLVTNNFSVAASYPLQLNIVGPGTVSPVTNGQSLLAGTTFQVTATPNPGQSFYSWTSNNSQFGSLNPTQTYTMSKNLSITATFVTNNLSNALAFTFPSANGIVGVGGPFNITGTATNFVSPKITLQIFSKSTSLAVTAPSSASGAATWGLTVPSGLLALGDYTVVAKGADSSGNSSLISEDFTVSSNAALQLIIVGNGTVSPVTNGQLLAVGTTFQVSATPNSGQAFYSWNNGSQASPLPLQSYTMANGLTLTATFVSNSMPNLISFTSPAANGIIGPGDFAISGAISNVPVAQVTVQIFGQGTAYTPQITSGTTNWSIQFPGLPFGLYTVLATGADYLGDSSLISENFSVASNALLQLNILGNGTVEPVTNGESLPIGKSFQVKATPAPGNVFYTWNNGAQISTNATQTYTMAGSLALTATFVPSNTTKGISFTSPAPRASLSTNSFAIKGKLSASLKNASITCQIFQTNGLTVGLPMTTTGTSSWSVTATNLAGGNYYVEALATNTAGLGAIASESFSIKAFAAAAGTYTGLFICSNSPVSPTNSGFLTFTVGANGVMSGKLVFPAYPAIPIYPLPFDNIDFTTAFTEFSLANFHGHPINGIIYLDLANGGGLASGTISSSNVWSSALFCYRAATKLSSNSVPPPGRYILTLQSEIQTNGPYTNGYADVTAGKNGALAVSGMLPDNTPFSHSARISDDGVWPLFAVPEGDGNKGMLLGWEVFTNTGNCAGQLYWYKSANVGAYYKGGVGIESNSLWNLAGTNFSRPGPGGVYTIIFQGGIITTPLTNFMTVNNLGQFVVSEEPADKLKISLSAAGVLTGSIVNSNKTLRFKGAFISPSQGGSGFIPEGKDQTGSFELQLMP